MIISCLANLAASMSRNLSFFMLFGDIGVAIDMLEIWCLVPCKLLADQMVLLTS